MAKKGRNQVAVGMTVSIVLVLTVYIVVMLADWRSLFTTQQEITVRMPYKVGLKGLSKGSPVRLGGVKIGHITNTGIKKLDPASTDGNDVYVFFAMKIPQQYRLRRDCVLVPQCNVLGGQVLLSIEDLGREGEIIRDGQTVDLPLAESIMEAVKREFDPDDPDSFLARLKKDITTITEQMQETIAKADAALENVQSTIKNIKEVTDDERIDMIISNISEVSVNLKLTAQEVRRAPWKLLYKPKKKEFKIQALVDSAGAFAAGAERLDSTALRLQRLIAATDDKQQVDKDKIESMVSELESSFEQFQEAERKFWEELK
ncbi:MAG: MlaD family protein [Planctomycetota bacterium]|jgi:ABC-type transporter Mla subunit MlaD